MSLPASVRSVLDTLSRHQVKALLMGGQACIVYGASEFSRDVDLAILGDEENLRALHAALEALGAGVIAVPPFAPELLRAGHAVHFRCTAPGVEGLRVDIMSRMRGVDPFPALWERRLVLDNGVPVMGLSDLVVAKKTQRDKDWPMIRRLVEADFLAHESHPRAGDLQFWLRESRTPSMLETLVERFPNEAGRHQRPAVVAAREHGGTEAIAEALRAEEAAERAADAAYWAPLKRELEELRRRRQREPMQES